MALLKKMIYMVIKLLVLMILVVEIMDSYNKRFYLNIKQKVNYLIFFRLTIHIWLIKCLSLKNKNFNKSLLYVASKYIFLKSWKKLLFLFTFVLGIWIPTFASNDLNNKGLQDSACTKADLLDHNLWNTSCAPCLKSECTKTFGVETCICIPVTNPDRYPDCF